MARAARRRSRLAAAARTRISLPVVLPRRSSRRRRAVTARVGAFSRCSLGVRVENIRFGRFALLGVLALVTPTLERDGELVDPRALDFEHGELHTVVGNVVADL